MKRTILLISLTTILFTGIFAMASNNTRDNVGEAPDRDRTARLWKEYESARNADKPLKQLEILEQIKESARENRLPWDFYKAGQEYVSVSVSRNWKLRDSLNRQFKNDIQLFDEPVLTFFDDRYNAAGKPDFATKNRDRLQKQRNENFYSADGNITGQVFSPVLTGTIENDWQYVLWSLVLRGEWSPASEQQECRELLAEDLNGKYPQAQLLELVPVLRTTDSFRKKEHLEQYVSKHGGKAVSLFARQELLKMRFNTLSRDEGSSEDFKALREECAAFEKDRKAYGGSEKKIAECCTGITALIETLDDKSVSFNIERGKLTARLKNLDRIELSILDKDKKTLFSTALSNNTRSYYVTDTVTFDMPAMDDGTYTVKCVGKDAAHKEEYERYRLSIALKEDSKGPAVYIADAITGEPLKKAGLLLTDDSGKKLGEIKDMNLNDGFTYLPASLVAKFSKDNWRNRLACSAKDSEGYTMKSRESRITNDYNYNGTVREDTYASIFTDRSAFNPEETLHFKAIVYRGDRSESLRTVGEGMALKAVLRDAEGNEISTRNFTTNEFGSIAGEFILERRDRNGRYTISVIDGNRELASASVDVDDFVLPSFELVFDPDNSIHFPGDLIEVKGTVRSYSGHNLAAANIRYTVSSGRGIVAEGMLQPDGTGRFSIPFKADSMDYSYYNVNVRVTDVTGETLEWNTGCTASRSIPFSASLKDREEVRISFSHEHEYSSGEDYEQGAVASDMIRLQLHTGGDEGDTQPGRNSLRISYSLSFKDKEIAKGGAGPGEILKFDTSSYPSGLYVFKATASDKDVYGNEVSSSVHFDILKVKDGDSSLDADVENFFRVLTDGRTAIQFGTTEGPVWACIELYGPGRKLLASRMVHLEGKKGEKGSLETIGFDRSPEWPAMVSFNMLYFKDYELHTYSHIFDRTAARTSLPLSFTRFFDKTVPGGEYTFELASLPGTEMVASIFDKSSETILSNRWSRVYLYPTERPSISYLTMSGRNGSHGIILFRNERMLMSKGAGDAMPAPMAMAAMDGEFEVEEEMVEEAMEVSFGRSWDDDSSADFDNIAVRENFAGTIAFEPFIRTDAEGRAGLPFTVSDKLSTFVVQVFAHTKDMDNAVLRKEMVVSVPVKVSIIEPQFLYAGDKYIAKASLSSNAEESVSGRLRLDFYDGKDYKSLTPVKSVQKKVTVEAGGVVSEELQMEIPQVRELGIRVSFIADDSGLGSDAMFVSVPVLEAVQTLTEAHSAVLHGGEELEPLVARLRQEFVNTSADDAQMRIISILDMVKEAIPDKADPSSDNVLDLSEALYVRLLAGKLGSEVNVAGVSNEDIIERMLACRNGDGGFGWFKGMDSSPVITAVLLQRYSALRKQDVLPSENSHAEEIVIAAVRYLDNEYFSAKGRPAWCGGLSFEQYLSTRVMFSEVEFSSKEIDKKALKAFKDEVKEYLTPKKVRGLNGYVLGKARRMQALLALSSSEHGRKLASAWGIRLGTARKLEKSLGKDLESLMEYAVEHRNGGFYYPNAVMPYRGLLESEAYAHAFISGLLDECSVKTGTQQAHGIADGIRLWLMLQKETQKWGEDAAFVDAISCILDGSQEVLDTKVVSLSKTFVTPLDEVKASGNGMTIERHFFVESNEDGKEILRELQEGEMLSVGELVRVEYHIWNEENRSFIKLTAPRSASLRPSEQVSGYYGWWLRPLSVSGWRTFSPSGYRSVLADRTEYWFDSYPEESTTVTEEFFVTQAGEFQIPAVSIESLYAPHYRANDAASSALVSN